jgi:CBS domain containing-hemolysin-like protein
LIIFLVLLSALFSGSETALFSLSRARLLSYKDDKSFSKRCIVSLMESYHNTLIVLILGNMFVNSAISMTQDSLFSNLSLPKLLATCLSILASIFVLLIFGEVTPKAIAISSAESISGKVSVLFYILCKILAPLIWIADRCFSFVLDILGRQEAKPLNHEEYNSYIEMANSFGAFSDEEAELIEDVFDISKIAVSKFMTCRVDIPSIQQNKSAVDTTDFIKHHRRKYYPIIEKDLDDTQFLISAKDFFLLSTDARQEWYKSKNLIPACFVPENTSLTKTLSIMKTNSVPVVLILDEYGGTCGMIEMEAIYEALLGDIEDEHDIADWQVKEVSKSILRLNGTMLLNEFEDIVDITLPSETKASTISGLFFEELDRLPVLGDSVTISGLMLKAIKISKHRVIEVEVELNKS